MTNPILITTTSELEEWANECHAAGETIGLVPTMGNLHAGHLSLVELACNEATRVVVSVFVNPTQFAPGEDFERYPRSLDTDIELLSTTAADVVFAPSVDEVYPPGSDEESVDPGPIGDVLEGAVRPGHFEGVLRVCKRLFEISHADVAVFGEKDAQQLFLVRKMVKERGLFTEILSVPIVRDTDGLALSSRNTYLSETDRDRALALPRALQLAKEALSSASIEVAVSQAKDFLTKAPGVQFEYLDVVSENTFLRAVKGVDQVVFIVGAIKVGKTRLIDSLRIPLS